MNPNDVELSKDDRRRIDGLASGGFTDEEAERIVRFSLLPRDDRRPSYLRPDVSTNGSHDAVDSKVPRSDAKGMGDDRDQSDPQIFDGFDRATCAAIRAAMAHADRPTDVTDRYDGKHPSVIYRHAQGRCRHDNVDVEPTVSPRIDTEECADMRRAYQFQGKDEDTIAKEFARSIKAVTSHVFGKCGHGNTYIAACDRDSSDTKD